VTKVLFWVASCGIIALQIKKIKFLIAPHAV